MAVKTVVVTGGNSGLGLECVRNLIKDPETTVVLACRDVTKGNDAKSELGNPAEIRVMELDLSSLDSVRKFVNDLKSANLLPLQGLVCNAGLQEILSPTQTKDGFETTFGVNHLGHFLLSQLLVGSMAPEGRIVFVSSGTHDPALKTGFPAPVYVNADQVAHDMEPGYYAGKRRYSTSKLCNVYCIYEFAKRLSKTSDEKLRSIRVNAFDPGFMPGTSLARQYAPLLQFLWNNILPALTLFSRKITSPRTSGKRLADLVTNPAISVTGKYFFEGKETRSSEFSYNTQNSKELWESSLKMVGLNQQL